MAQPVAQPVAPQRDQTPAAPVVAPVVATPAPAVAPEVEEESDEDEFAGWRGSMPSAPADGEFEEPAAQPLLGPRMPLLAF